ncbi:hypothetical protein GOZ78_03655 [Agrobacterium vitis]|uniref:hypothetical protein n=1 Tax=Agrobacterium vitis TaxID=373 RepID=UPI001160292F|nr:hypothetical protein [Agrobacterium vitis]MUO96640.1 hypothetical protein [Agrobacterium vitis]MUZ80749.1 hypothetical protein [Agrobacterium vitis]MVA09115.1 hypothetical protein [Agrobacterium vitis]MVA33624.1 hypothetical protein [Agrobacterium vitis]MVA93171.1 hypothetical protein [Agrobacterium vitis]
MNATHPLDQMTDESSRIEDTMFDMKAMLRFGLHMTESCTEEEFGQYRNDWCTLMYLLLDKIKTINDANDHLMAAARKTATMETMQ